MDIAELTTEDLERELRRRKQPAFCTPHEAPVEVTVCIIGCNDWFRRLEDTLGRLWAQGVRMNLLLATDSSSIDPTRVLFRDPDTHRYLERHRSATIASCEYIGDIPHQETLEQTLAFAKTSFMAEVKTPYVFFLDADVHLDMGTIRDCLQILKSDPKAGAVAVAYSLKSDHDEQGAMLFRSDQIREISFDGRPDDAAKTRCVCMNIARDLAARNLQIVRLERDALHAKWR